MTLDEKVAATIRFASSLIRAGWKTDAAIVNSQNLYHLSKKRMRVVSAAVENAVLSGKAVEE